LYKKTFGELMSVAMRYSLSKEDAEENFDSGFLQILKGLSSYDLSRPFFPWAKRVMLNYCIRQYHQSKNKTPAAASNKFNDEMPDKYGVTFNEADSKFTYEDVMAMIRKLPSVTSKVFLLHIVEGIPHKEIAGMMKIAEGTSKWHVNNARNLLREMINNQLKNEL
jgi:RNA polymerase sigma factor (sigma-70 family)